VIPKTTTIGSYPAFPRPEDVEYYYTISSHGLGDEVVDPYLWSVEECLNDFTSSGIEVPSTGQTRGDLYSLFLDPKFVGGVSWDGAEASVNDKIERLGGVRLSDVQYARSVLPSHFELKEPLTDAYTLARFSKIHTSSYSDTRELAKDINRKIIIPELESLQKSGAVSYLQLDSPTIASESSTPDYILDLYEEAAAAAKIPLVLHVCGDTARIFGMLTKAKVHVLSLDFYHYPKLFDEASARSYDQRIGLGCSDSQNPRIDSVEDIRRLIEYARSRFGEDRVEFVHPHCGQRNLNREAAYEKNVNLVLARDDAYNGEAEEATRSRLKTKEYDPKGYFLVSVKRETKEIFVTYYSYKHQVIRRYRSRFAERIFQSLNEEADGLGISRRHLAYLTLELGRAEASLTTAQVFRQKVVE
jgi:methionine synthase II (cobalamin-independent)